jgi:hypothetical protein
MRSYSACDLACRDVHPIGRVDQCLQLDSAFHWSTAKLHWTNNHNGLEAVMDLA